jgi:hypothetical protein
LGRIIIRRMNARTDSSAAAANPSSPAATSAEAAAAQPVPAMLATDIQPAVVNTPDIAERSGPDQQQFVDWLRAVAPYIHAFRGKIFVIAFGGELVKAGMLNALVNDVALLHAMGMQIVLVHGSRPQVEEQLALRQVASRFEAGVRITDNAALECAKEAAGELRLDIEAAFSQGLPNTPMAGRNCRWSPATSSPRGPWASSRASITSTRAWCARSMASRCGCRSRTARSCCCRRWASRRPGRPSICRWRTWPAPPPPCSRPTS